MSAISRPVIGITSHLIDQTDPAGRTGSFLRVGAAYARAVKDAGGLPVLLPATEDVAVEPEDTVRVIDGLLLSGGSGLPTGAFTTRLEPTLRETNPPRYDHEVQLVREAHRKGLPIMGICRGHQTLVEALGGTLVLNVHIEGRAGFNHYQDSAPDRPSHDIELIAGQWPADCLGTRISVNSFHRQAVATLPEGLSVAALSEDGLIEAVTSPDPFILGLQFHPEHLYHRRPRFLKLFEMFVRQAGVYAQR